ncbi:MAG: hypothetical protein RR700_06420 [Anaerorhabdus sp.]|uniref:hypothetical protein n=1 Tax=Anaerorhabdus sp. TaxID=1872524 RepID=UPI002FC735AA
MEKENYEHLRQLLEEIDGRLIEVTNDISELDDVADFQELLIEMENVQYSLTTWLENHQTFEQSVTNEVETVYGYVIGNHGECGDPFEFTGTMENIANFIMSQECNRIEIKDYFGDLYVSTFGTFVDKVCSEEYRLALLEELLPRQNGEIEIGEVPYLEEGTTLSEFNEIGMQMR